jgi:hypothetical protein
MAQATGGNVKKLFGVIYKTIIFTLSFERGYADSSANYTENSFTSLATGVWCLGGTTIVFTSLNP